MAMSPRNPETNAEMRERSRARLVEAAGRLFEERGYDATSLSAITSEAGLSHGLARYYFDSKHEVLAEVLEPHLESTLDLLNSLPEDPREALATLIDRSLETASQAPASVGFLLSTMLQPGPRTIFAGLEQRLADRVDEAYERVQELFASLGSPDPITEAVLFRSVLDGAVFSIAAYPEAYPVAAIRQRLHALYDLPTPAQWPTSSGETDDTASGREHLRASVIRPA